MILLAKIELKNISKTYENRNETTIENFNLSIDEKEFIVLVGPSGCGKSTTLRMIAGLEEITDGELWMNGKKMNNIAPKDRNISMVFQNYALFPHLSVAENISFGLKVRKYKKQEIEKLVKETAAVVGLEALLKKKPKELSGGQKQRVALARAIVKQTDIFLMDEPLSNLDAKLRTQMREEVIQLHRKLQTTTIYVTHDQVEAMTMATRIVILKDGDIQQVGTPYEVFRFPQSKFVAGFIGTPAMNFLPVSYQNKMLYLEGGSLLSESLILPFNKTEWTLGIRPEDIHVDNEKGLPATIEYMELLGSELLLHLNHESYSFLAKVHHSQSYQEGQQIYLQFPKENFYLFDKENDRTWYSKGAFLHEGK